VEEILRPKISSVVAKPPVREVDGETPVARFVIGAMRGALKTAREID
jgi:hypothetical protein